MKKTVIISFSGRSSGNCEQISDFISSEIHKNAIQYHFSEFTIQSCGKCTYECMTKEKACPHIGDIECRILTDICNSEETIMIVPNYSGYPCSNFFTFNERSLCWFMNHPDRLDDYSSVPKKFIVVSNTEINNFKDIFAQHTDHNPKILQLSPKEFQKSSQTADLITSAKAKRCIRGFFGK